jgi:hypothetical protein
MDGQSTRPDPSAAVVALSDLLAELRAGRTAEAGRPPEDGAAALLQALVMLRGLREAISGWEPELITAAREAGVSWALLAPALGVTSRQAAERRYLRLQPTLTGEATGEGRVQVTRDGRAGDRAVSQWAQRNAAVLRGLAGQVSALPDLDAHSRRHADRVREALGGDDVSALLGSLADMRGHLVADHPRLAAQIRDLTTDAEHRRAETIHQRHAPGRTGVGST